MNVQVIMKDGRPEWAVLPYKEYEKLLAALESVGMAPAAAVTVMEPVPEPAAPSAAVTQSLQEGGADGEEFSAARLVQLRQQKGMEVAALAQAVGISTHYLQQMEEGEREPSEPILRNIARALQCDESELLE